jgi:hypothetical protein
MPHIQKAQPQESRHQLQLRRLRRLCIRRVAEQAGVHIERKMPEGALRGITRHEAVGKEGRLQYVRGRGRLILPTVSAASRPRPRWSLGRIHYSRS